MGERRALARLARRSVTHAPLRSALMVALVAILVAGGTSVGIISRSGVAVLADQLESLVGSGNTELTFGATPAALDGEFVPIPESEAQVWHTSFEQAGGVDAVRASFGVPTAVVRSGSLHPDAVGGGGPFGQQAPLASPNAIDEFIWGYDTNEPLVEGLLDLVDGRFPTAANEVATTPLNAELAGYELGQVVPIGKDSFTLVGLIASPLSRYHNMWLVSASGFDVLDISDQSLQYSVSAQLDRGNVAQALNDAQEIVGHAGRGIYSELRLQRGDLGEFVVTDVPIEHDPRRSNEVESVLAPSVITLVFGTLLVMVGAVVFAVGIRRRTHELGQLVANGANGDHLRRVLRYEAGWLGLAGAVLGIALAIGFSHVALAAGWFPQVGDRYFTEVRLRLRDLFGPALVGFLSVLVAASWAAAKLEDWAPTSALSGVLPVSPSVAMRARWGLLCLAVALGLPWAFSGTFLDRVPAGPALVAVLSILLGVVGVIIVANAVLAAAARQAEQLPLLPRLVIRSTGRDRSRSSVVIGIMTIVVVVAVLVGAALDSYRPWSGPSSSSTTTSSGVDVSDDTLSTSFRSTSGDSSRSGSSAEFPNRVFSVEAIASASPESSAKRNIIEDLGAVEGDLLVAAAERFGPVAAAELLQVPASIYWESSPLQYASVRGGTVYVATPEIVQLLGIGDALAAEMEAGAAVDVSGQDWTVDGEMVIRTTGGESQVSIDLVDGPRAFVDRSVYLIGPEIAAQLSVEPFVVGSLYVTERSTDSEARAEFLDDANQIWVNRHGAYLKKDYVDEVFSFGRSQLVSVFYETEAAPDSSVAVLAVISIAVAAVIALLTASLSAVEFDREASLMVAVGALPSLRRWFLATQTLYQFAVAVVVGVPLGVILYNGWVRFDVAGPADLVVPWTVIGLVGIVLPIGVAATVGLLFRDGTPAVSRRVA